MPESQFQALLRLKWIHWTDPLFFLFTIASLVVSVVKGGWFIVPPVVVLPVWITILCFRTSYFTVHLLADTKLLPEKAARIALPYLNRSSELPGEATWPSFKVQLPYLRQVGWIRGVDILALLALLSCWSVGIWSIWEGWTLPARIAFTASVAVNILWIVVLLLRVSHFVLHCVSEVKLLPVEASRLIVMFQRQLPGS